MHVTLHVAVAGLMDSVVQGTADSNRHPEKKVIKESCPMGKFHGNLHSIFYLESL